LSRHYSFRPDIETFTHKKSPAGLGPAGLFNDNCKRAAKELITSCRPCHPCRPSRQHQRQRRLCHPRARPKSRLPWSGAGRQSKRHFPGPDGSPWWGR